MPTDIERYNEIIDNISKAKVFLSGPYTKISPPWNETGKTFTPTVETEYPFEIRENIVKTKYAVLNVFNHGNLYGDGVFEGIGIFQSAFPEGIGIFHMATKNQIFLLKEHLDRFWDSAKGMRISIPYTQQELAQRLIRVCRRAKLHEMEKGKTSYIRLVLTRGIGDLGINDKNVIQPTLYAIANNIKLFPEKKYETGIEAVVVDNRRTPRGCVNPNIKTLNYIPNILGRIQVNDACVIYKKDILEGIMLNLFGKVTECTADNIFIVEKKHGKRILHTPNEQEILVGCTRNLVIELAKKKGYEIRERNDINVSEFYGKDKEVFITGTACKMMPVVGIGQNNEMRKTGNGEPGEITLDLIAEFKKEIENPKRGLSLEAKLKDIKTYLNR